MIKLDEHYVDPRLVELYDIENPRGADADFYLDLAAELDAHRILELGCGTGLLTRELATPGRQVVGVDPSPAMLAFARRQPGAGRVQWVEGDARALGTPEADLLVMTGNVAQVFLDTVHPLGQIKQGEVAIGAGTPITAQRLELNPIRRLSFRAQTLTDSPGPPPSSGRPTRDCTACCPRREAMAAHRPSPMGTVLLGWASPACTCARVYTTPLQITTGSPAAIG